MSGKNRDFAFVEGRLVPTSPPAWFVKATSEESNWSTALTKAGARPLEDFGDGGDNIEIYQGPEGDYYVGYWDPGECIAHIFIDNVADYLSFRAQYVAPLASLIMESDRHFVWQQAQKLKRTG